jgi:oligopeptide transport system substrate-binding protein
MTIRRFLAGAFAGFLLLAGAAEASTLTVQIAEAPASLDPQKATGERPDLVIGDLFEGLVADDAQGRPVPGQAESWSISPDGLIYTFHLRKGLRWSDGEPLTADDFVFAFRRLVDPATAADFAYIQFPVKNAEAINSGKSEDIGALGVSAPDPHTLIITLERRTPYFLDALLQPSAYPLPRHVISGFGANWAEPDHIVGNGPYKLVEARPEFIRAVRSETYRNATSVQITSVVYQVLDEVTALTAFDEGRADIATRFATRGGYQRKALHRTPTLGLWYLVLNSSEAPLQQPEIRQALSMAIDREALTAAIGAGDLPAFGIVPPGVPGFKANAYLPSWADAPLADRQAKARRVLTKLGYGTGNPLRFTLRTSNRDSQIKMGETVAHMWAAIGVAVDLMSTDIPTHQAALFKGDFMVAGARWILDYNDAADVLGLLASDHPNNYQSYTNPALNAALAAARREADNNKRIVTLREIERRAMDDGALIPLFWMTSHTLVAPAVSGFRDNVRDVHRTRWLEKRD